MPRTRHVHLLIALCAVALLVAQMLGALHRIQHAGHGQWPATAGSLNKSTKVATTVRGAKSPAPSKTSMVLSSLFGHHDTAGACDLYDQSSHGDALWSAPVVVLPVAFAPSPDRVHRTWHLAAQAAGFLARGPPTSS